MDSVPRMTRPDRRRSISCIFILAMLGVVANILLSPTVISLLAIKLGAGEVYLGFISFVALMPFIFSLRMLPIMEFQGKRRILLRWSIMSCLMTLPWLIIPALAKSGAATLCLTLILISIFFRATSESFMFSAWFPIIQDIVPRRLTGRFFGNLRTSWQAVALGLLLFVAGFMGKDPPWWKFNLIFAVVSVALLIRIRFFIPLSENPPLKSYHERSKLGEILKEFFKSPNELKILAYVLSYAAAFGMSVPFQVKLLKNLGYGDGVILAASAMINAGAIISLRFWGRLADRVGNRIIFSVSHIGMIVITALWIVIQHDTFSSVLVFILFFVNSIFNSGNGIAQTRYLMHTIPADRQNHLVIVNTAMIAMWGFSPLLAGFFLKATSGLNFGVCGQIFDNYDLLFAINAGLFIIPHVLRRHLRAAKDMPTFQALMLIFRARQ